MIGGGNGDAGNEDEKNGDDRGFKVLCDLSQQEYVPYGMRDQKGAALAMGFAKCR